MKISPIFKPSIPVEITLAIAAVFLYGFVTITTSPNGIMGWGGMFGFCVIFPFYLVASLFVGRFNWFSYGILFLFASGFYIVLAYKAALGLQQKAINYWHLIFRIKSIVPKTPMRKRMANGINILSFKRTKEI